MSEGTAKKDPLASRSEETARVASYPIASEIPAEQLAAEIAELERLQQRPLPLRLLGYARLGGPGFMDAALTLGAGTLTAAMLSGATFGYRTMWLIWLSVVLGAFMLAASARFTCRGGFRVIAMQNRYHGWILGSLMTGLVGTAAVAVIFNYGQYSLGTHLIESLAPLLGFEFPREVNWIVYMAVTSSLCLLYGRGRRGIWLVETYMKASLATMLLGFGACLFVVGVDFRGMLRGTFIPWLPSGTEGVDLLIASSAAAVGVLDWVFFQYTGLARGWGRRHETLARFDIAIGLVIPFIVVNYLVIAVFGRTLHRLGGALPESATELAGALAPLLGPTWSQLLFYVGFLAVPISTTVGMSLAGAMAIHEAFSWEPDTRSWRWRISVLLPQIGFLAVWYPRPLWLVVAIGAFLSLANNIVGWSFYLLLNDRRVLGEDRSQSYGWNLGIMLQITLLNGVALLYIFNRLGWWGA